MWDTKLFLNLLLVHGKCGGWEGERWGHAHLQIPAACKMYITWTTLWRTHFPDLRHVYNMSFHHNKTAIDKGFPNVKDHIRSHWDFCHEIADEDFNARRLRPSAFLLCIRNIKMGTFNTDAFKSYYLRAVSKIFSFWNCLKIVFCPHKFCFYCRSQLTKQNGSVNVQYMMFNKKIVRF